MIYFLQRSNGDIKIGVTINLNQRLSQLRKKHGNLNVIRVVEGYERKEWQLHQRFAPLRQDGEWFTPAPELLAYINECKATDRILDTSVASIPVRHIYLKRLMDERGLSISDIQFGAKLNNSTVRRWASGNVQRLDSELVERVCAFLDCDRYQLFD